MLKVFEQCDHSNSFIDIRNERSLFNVSFHFNSEGSSEIWVYDNTEPNIRCSVGYTTDGKVVGKFVFIYDNQGNLLEDFYYGNPLHLLRRHGKYVINDNGFRIREYQMDGSDNLIYIVEYLIPGAGGKRRFLDDVGREIPEPIEFWK